MQSHQTILKSISSEIKLKEASPPVVKAIQIQLMRLGLLHGVADGVVDIATIDALARFKKIEYLEHPDRIGPTTANALLDATEQHPIPKENSFKPTGSNIVRIPELGLVATNQSVYPGSHFSWGELTKGCSRVPETSEVVRNLIRLARYLDKMRVFLGNRPIAIKSGYRPPGVNRAIGGVPNSRHIFGDAADIVVQGIPPIDVYQQIIDWHGDKGGLGRSNSFTHVDLRGYRARWKYGNA